MIITYQLLLAWLGLTSLVTFLLFGYDKYQASREGYRVSEFNLCLAAALGGWLGGLLAMLCFRHKTLKASFKLKYAFAFLVWAALLYAGYHERGIDLASLFQNRIK